MSVAEVSHDAAHRRLQQERICIVSPLWLERIRPTMTLRVYFAGCDTITLGFCCRGKKSVVALHHDALR